MIVYFLIAALFYCFLAWLMRFDWFQRQFSANVPISNYERKSLAGFFVLLSIVWPIVILVAVGSAVGYVVFKLIYTVFCNLSGTK
jgi:nitrate reductase NapE component